MNFPPAWSAGGSAFAKNRSSSSPLAVGALVVANVLPVLGLLALGWGLFPLMLLYWVENGIIGLFNIVRMLLAVKPVVSGVSPPRQAGLAAKLGMALFFTIHYGIFWVGHGAFVMAFFGGMIRFSSSEPSEFSLSRLDPLLLMAPVALLISHGVSLAVNYIGRGEYLRTDPQTQMMAPYARVMILHFTIILGGFATMALGEPTLALLLLVVLKTGYDLYAHLIEHEKAQRPEAGGEVG